MWSLSLCLLCVCTVGLVFLCRCTCTRGLSSLLLSAPRSAVVALFVMCIACVRVHCMHARVAYPFAAHPCACARAHENMHVCILCNVTFCSLALVCVDVCACACACVCRRTGTSRSPQPTSIRILQRLNTSLPCTCTCDCLGMSPTHPYPPPPHTLLPRKSAGGEETGVWRCV